jgi:ATP-binding cassette subfamily F protein 3
MTILSLSGASYSFGAEDFLQDVTCSVNAADRIGLVGPNGAGKTTLLRLLAGALQPMSGRRHLARGVRVSLVEQMAPESGSLRSVREEAREALRPLLDLEASLNEAALALEHGRPGAHETYADLQQRFELAGGFTYESRLQQVLQGLGFSAGDFDMPVSALSGGQRSRLGLARALLESPDVLLLDEPTNHLDFAGLAWIEDYLRRWAGSLVVASHDRYFLDRVVNRVWLLDGRRLRAYRGNYTAFHEARQQDIERQRAEHEAQQEFIAREEAFIRRYRAGHKAREARGRATRLARLERIEAPSKQKSAAFRLTAGRTGEVVLSARDLAAGYGRVPLLTPGSFEIERGARIALIGPNGAGKTTLLRTLAGELAPVGGELALGANVKLAHYWQEAEDLDPGRTVLEEVLYLPGITPQRARDLLGLMLFSGTDVDKPVSGLSGGERGRLALAKLTVSRANLLLLDEPTNHLDIPSREALEAALDQFEGTIVFASHDRRLISRLATRLWFVEEGRMRTFEGTFAEFEAGAAPEPVEKPEPARAVARSPFSQNRRQRLQADLAVVEAEVQEIERELETLPAAINAASEQGDLLLLNDLGRRFDALQSLLEERVERWSELQQALESASVS